MNKQSCPQCGLLHIKKNGPTWYGKQNYQSLSCHGVAKDKKVFREKWKIALELLDQLALDHFEDRSY